MFGITRLRPGKRQSGLAQGSFGGDDLLAVFYIVDSEGAARRVAGIGEAAFKSVGIEDIDAQKYPSVYNRVRKLLLGAPHAVNEYTMMHGEIKALQPEKPEKKHV